MTQTNCLSSIIMRIGQTQRILGFGTLRVKQNENTSVWKPMIAVTFNKFNAFNIYIDVDVGYYLLLAENNLFAQWLNH